MNVYEVIREPLLTEKGTKLAAQRKYFFKVRISAKKHEIREAIERIFNVKVDCVNTMVVPGKWKRVRVRAGQTSEWKKAIVTLKEGHKIEFS